jgi:hypothetical protein
MAVPALARCSMPRLATWRIDYHTGGSARGPSRCRQSLSHRLDPGQHLTRTRASMFTGGVKFERQKFNQAVAEMGASLLLLAAVGLLILALFHFTAADRGIVIERE